MKMAYKVSLCCLLSLICSLPAAGQNAGTVPDPCGDPTAESFSCPLLRGKVSEVSDGDAIVLTLPGGRRLRVRLAGIAAPELRQKYGRDARVLLSSLVLGRVVEVCVSARQYLLVRDSNAREVTGAVHVRGMGMLDVNLMMIQAGLARHAEAGPGSMSGHAGCHYARAEAEARAARRGLW